jgi:photosystem II stability/assembly factor-like uncharacterized protein
MSRFFCAFIGLVATYLLPVNVATGQTITIKEINPTHTIDVGTVSGGRVNQLGRATNSIFYAASEFGGLFKSTDRGRTWARLDSYLPTRVSDVKVSPADPNLVIATSLYDGRVSSLAGINVSRNGGKDWSTPASSRPPVGSCKKDTALTEPSAFGIAFDPENAAHVFVGTDCGLAKSEDSGVTWTFINPNTNSLATKVVGVLVHHGGIIDICGSGGHHRSKNGGADWMGPDAGGRPLPSGGSCSIAASPDEASVLFATVGIRIFESDNEGRSWNTEYVNAKPQGRVPFVVTNKRQGRNFDLWFGDVNLFRAACRTPATPGPAARCPPSSTWVKLTKGAHPDMGVLVFTKPPLNASACRQNCTNNEIRCSSECDDNFNKCMARVGEAGGPLKSQCDQALARCESACTSGFNACTTNCTEGCPVVLATDGGTHFNALTQSPACQTPAWTQPTVTTRGLSLWSLSGANIPNSPIGEAVYMGTQDNGSFATLNAGAAIPAWARTQGGDIFDIVSDTTRVVFIQSSPEPGNAVFISKPGNIGASEIPNYPPGLVPGAMFPAKIARFGANRYAIITDKGIFATTSISSNPIIWSSLGTNAPLKACGLWAAGSSANPTFYALTGIASTRRCSGNSPKGLMRFNGISTTGTWQDVPLPDGSAGLVVFTVDPHHPNRLFVSAFNNLSSGIGMFRSSNGGIDWQSDPELDSLMSGGGVFRLQTSTYAQPTLVAFDTDDTNNLLAGAYDAGIFFSRDNGESWKTVTNNSGDAANPVIPRPHWAYFDRECGRHNIYVGTQGRGAWHFSYADSDGTTVSACQSRCEASFTECQSDCQKLFDECMGETGPGKHLPSQCASARNSCSAVCSNTRNTCRQRCVDCPQ